MIKSYGQLQAVSKLMSTPDIHISMLVAYLSF